MNTVSSIHRYPVKSMIGEDVANAVVGERGLLGDRAFALVDLEDGSVASAKHPRKWSALLLMSARFVAEPARGAPSPDVEITFADGRTVRSDDPDVDRRLGDVLGRPVHLTREPTEGGRFEEIWPAIEGLAPQRFIDATATGTDPDGLSISSIPLGSLAPPRTFFDVATLHLLTTGTLRTLRTREPAADFDARRYRPNLVIDTDTDTDTDTDDYAEDGWVGSTLRVGAHLRLAVAMASMRCVMTTLAQRGLGADPRTLRAIARHHRLEIPQLGTWACAGAYATVAGSSARVQVGDDVVLEDVQRG